MSDLAEVVWQTGHLSPQLAKHDAGKEKPGKKALESSSSMATGIRWLTISVFKTDSLMVALHALWWPSCYAFLIAILT